MNDEERIVCRYYSETDPIFSKLKKYHLHHYIIHIIFFAAIK